MNKKQYLEIAKSLNKKTQEKEEELSTLTKKLLKSKYKYQSISILSKIRDKLELTDDEYEVFIYNFHEARALTKLMKTLI